MSTTPDIIGIAKMIVAGEIAHGTTDYALASALLEQTEKIAQLERECGKWQAQAEIAKEQSTTWMAENEKMRQHLEDTECSDYAYVVKTGALLDSLRSLPTS